MKFSFTSREYDLLRQAVDEMRLGSYADEFRRGYINALLMKMDRQRRESAVRMSTAKGPRHAVVTSN